MKWNEKLLAKVSPENRQGFADIGKAALAAALTAGLVMGGAALADHVVSDLSKKFSTTDADRVEPTETDDSLTVLLDLYQGRSPQEG